MENKASFSEKLLTALFWGTILAAFAFGGAEVLGYSPVVSTVIAYAITLGVAFNE